MFDSLIRYGVRAAPLSSVSLGSDLGLQLFDAEMVVFKSYPGNVVAHLKLNVSRKELVGKTCFAKAFADPQIKRKPGD